ncbi:tyrosine-protein phosphatase [Flavobacterium sp.]|uniref:tyrosine-protein phosphatase n=1 Tax=Flavobacterium sp. TaxID=239 RepID=UPI002ED9113A
MFSIFKTKHYLKDILPKNYIDIHNHLLPGIDDGARTVEETTALIADMKTLNIHKSIATPHTYSSKWNNTSEIIKAAYETAIEDNANRSFIKKYASEYMLDASLMEKIKNERLLCIDDHFLLIEFPLFSNPFNLYEMLFELKIRDYKIIIAHPERYLYLHDSIEKYEKLKDFGVYFQLNLLSLTGYYGRNIYKNSLQLLEKNMYDFTGSDIHSNAEINQFETTPLQIRTKSKLDQLLLNNSIFLK